MLLLFLPWLSSAVASEPARTPSDPSAGAPAEADGSAFSDRLERAKKAYFEGRTDAALEEFQKLELRLKLGESPQWDQSTEAMTYLGEIYLSRDEEHKAEAAFRWVLEKDPTTPMPSPYRHPVEVVSLFEDVREQVSRERRQPVPDEPPPTVRIRPPPWWTFAPLGVPQFVEGRPVRGAFWFALQAGFAVTSIVTNEQLQRFKLDPSGGNNTAPPGFYQEYTRRRIVQNASFGLTPLAYIGSVIDVRTVWNKEHKRRELSVGVLPSRAPGLVVRGTL